MILFGGENATTWFTNDLYELEATSTGFEWSVLPQNNPPPPISNARAVYMERMDAMVVLGGITNATQNMYLPMQVYSYFFTNQTWVPAASNNEINDTIVPNNRRDFAVAADQQNNRIYIYGGGINSTAINNDLWILDTTSMTFTQLPPTDVGHYGHSISLLRYNAYTHAHIFSNNALVVTGGVRVKSDMTMDLAPMDQLYVFNTQSGTWSIATTSGTVPSTRSNHNAVVDANDRIILFGGDNGGPMRWRSYINGVAVLNTDFTWTTPSNQGIPPSRRSYASAAILDGAHLTVAFGSSLNTWYNDINVLALDSITEGYSSWLQSYTAEDSDSSSGWSPGVIAGVTIALVVVVIILIVLLWKFQRYVRWLVMRIHHDIWRPRTGEPLWAETTRIICQIFLLFLFVLCLVFIIRQAISSPHVTQRIIEPAAQVDVPDLRFCFDGFPDYESPTDMRKPGLTCQTDTGTPCASYIQALDPAIFTPVFADALGPVTCFLFRAPPDFKLTSTSGDNVGARLLFTMFGDQSVASYARVHVSVYPKSMDPNVRVYGINDTVDVLLSDEEVSNWLNNERNDLQATNVYSLAPLSYSVMSYDLIDHRYLQDYGWNYVGFSPITNSSFEIETNFRQEAQNPNYMQTHQDIGLFVVYPETFANIMDREVKVYTLMNALGFVGGIFGLLLTVQVWLFGYRPRSPWGIVQRWSFGDMKRSLLRGLSTSFRTTESSGIPFIHPVHRRFSMLYNNNRPGELPTESNGERVARVEERMQVLELLFKSYYVDDEIFRSLDYATRRDLANVHGANDRLVANSPISPEKPQLTLNHHQHDDDQQPVDATGFSHLFRNTTPAGESSTTLDDDRESSTHQLRNNGNTPPHDSH
ncbi:hypothetical protein RO3G_02372 [Lichtheimia corymbifera JMRC:FSU:9682]|uniref:Galactose oxidase n=1 Tax=Lichtheimia corymbifera JMRC:FSU:9682 TaxID=1263082 RepID=A0A068RWH1_9FUNG|nr:hypothetical protein RO3G_02372 [Lichtheimia corymbifera JMRC:FSU:9682]